MLRKENRTGDYDEDDGDDYVDHDDDDVDYGDDQDDHDVVDYDDDGDDDFVDDDDDYHCDDLLASAVTVRCERSETVKSAPSTASTW